MDKDNENNTGNRFEGKKRPVTKNIKKVSEKLRNGEESGLGHRPSLQWSLDARFVCEPVRPAICSTDRLVAIEEKIAESRTGLELLEQKKENNIRIDFCEQIRKSQYYPQKNLILINPHRSEAESLLLMVRELRRVWQNFKGLLSNPLKYEPDEAVLLNRAQQADCLMVSIRVAWELNLTGTREIWNYLVGSPVGDLTRSYAYEAQKDFRSMNNGTASRLIYDKWFASDRIKIHDRRVIHEMLLNDQTPDENQPLLSNETLMALGELPLGRNYLSLQGYKQPTDLDYSSIEDRSNANFLWFIKFERSFQQKEQQLYDDIIPSQAEVISFNEKFSESEDNEITDFSGSGTIVPFSFECDERR